MSNSCLQCRWLFTRDDGYSNYTVMDTKLHCVFKRNPKLPEDIPEEVMDCRRTGPNAWGNVWVMGPDNDKWHATRDGRCDLYQLLPEGQRLPEIDVDGEEIMSLPDATKHMLETADPMPMLIAQYFDKEK